MAESEDAERVRGDGGPIVVLQAEAVSGWIGAADFEESLMNGGTVETQYDLICAGDDSVKVLNLQGRDMLVLSDSSWGAGFFTVDSAELAILQSFGSDRTDAELVSHLTAQKPAAEICFRMVDAKLRLLVGSDGGNGDMYGYTEHELAPGQKRCDVYASTEGQVLLISNDPARL